MDRLDLLVEVVLLLGLLHLLLDLVVDPAVDVDLLDLDLQQVLELLETLVGRLGLEERLLLGGRDGQVRRERVGEALGVVDLERRREALEGQVVRELGVLLEEREHLAPCSRVRLVGVGGLDRAASSTATDRYSPRALEGQDPAAPHALDHHLDVAVGELQGLGDRRDDADLVDVLGLGLVELRVLLGGEEEPLAGVASAASRARIEDSRPTTKGCIMWGKTTMSRRGTSGRLSSPGRRYRFSSVVCHLEVPIRMPESGFRVRLTPPCAGS